MQTDFMAAREGTGAHVNGAPFNRCDIRETEEPNFAAVLKNIKIHPDIEQQNSLLWLENTK